MERNARLDQPDHDLRQAIAAAVQDQPACELAPAWQRIATRLAAKQQVKRHQRRVLSIGALTAMALLMVALAMPRQTAAVGEYLIRQFSYRVEGVLKGVSLWIGPAAREPLAPPVIQDLGAPQVLSYQSLAALEAEVGFSVPVPGWVPEGWQFEQAKLMRGQATDWIQIILWYRSAHGETSTLTIRPKGETGMGFMAHPEREVKDVAVNGQPGTLTTVQGEFATLVWPGRDFLFVLYARLDEASILKIAESIP